MYIVHYIICLHMPKGGTSWQSIYTTNYNQSKYFLAEYYWNMGHLGTEYQTCNVLYENASSFNSILELINSKVLAKCSSHT